MPTAVREFLVRDLGLRSYAEALSLQRELAADRISKKLDRDLLLRVGVLRQSCPNCLLNRLPSAAWRRRCNERQIGQQRA